MKTTRVEAPTYLDDEELQDQRKPFSISISERERRETGEYAFLLQAETERQTKEATEVREAALQHIRKELPRLREAYPDLHRAWIAKQRRFGAAS